MKFFSKIKKKRNFKDLRRNLPMLLNSVRTYFVEALQLNSAGAPRPLSRNNKPCLATAP